jgi:hypothetical protein
MVNILSEKMNNKMSEIILIIVNRDIKNPKRIIKRTIFSNYVLELLDV